MHDFDVVLNELRHPTMRSWILMSPSSIGETSVLCSLLQGFQKHHRLPITLVIPPAHKSIPDFFSIKPLRIAYASVNLMRAVSSNAAVFRNQFMPDFPINTWANMLNDWRPLNLYNLWVSSNGQRGLDFIDLYRYNLRLPWDTPIERPSAPLRVNNLAKENCEKLHISGRFAVIHAGNNTNAPISPIILQAIINALRSEGITVVLNTGGAAHVTELPDISNVFKLNLDVESAIGLSVTADIIISGSNGLAMLLSAMPLRGVLNVILPCGKIVANSEGKECIAPMSFAEGSLINVAREWVNLDNKYYEWSIPENLGESELSRVTSAITARCGLKGYSDTIST